MVLAQASTDDHHQSPAEIRQLECRSRGVLYGVATGSISFVSLYFVQRYFTRNIRGVSRGSILVSSGIFAAISAYLIVDTKWKECAKNAKAK